MIMLPLSANNSVQCVIQEKCDISSICQILSYSYRLYHAYLAGFILMIYQEGLNKLRRIWWVRVRTDSRYMFRKVMAFKSRTCLNDFDKIT